MKVDKGRHQGHRRCDSEDGLKNKWKREKENKR